MTSHMYFYGREELCCTVHLCTIDVWYDCPSCLQESSSWAKAHGFTQCISPHVAPREGTDNGEWVRLKARRWHILTEEGLNRLLNERKQRHARFRGLVRAIVMLKRKRLEASVRLYEPCGLGFESAAKRFKHAATSRG